MNITTIEKMLKKIENKESGKIYIVDNKDGKYIMDGKEVTRKEVDKLEGQVIMIVDAKDQIKQNAKNKLK